MTLILINQILDINNPFPKMIQTEENLGITHHVVSTMVREEALPRDDLMMDHLDLMTEEDQEEEDLEGVEEDGMMDLVMISI